MLNPRTFYTLALWLLLPYIFMHLAWRARKQPEYLQHIGERFGCYPQRSENQNSIQPVIWLHAVSVGETRATQSLVTRLQETYPQHRILLTHTTPTGRATSEQLYGDSVMRVYLPYDYPFAVKRFLHHFRPQLGMLMETEIWVNLIHTCHESGIPLLLLNARMSEKSAKGYANFAKLTCTALGELNTVAAQTDDDAARLIALGAKNILVMGNLKFDIEPSPIMLALGKQLREKFGAQRKVFLAASTRDGEEALLFDALQQLNDPALLVVIVPRHPQRFDQVAQLLEQRDITYQRRSTDKPVLDTTSVVLGDSMGEMFAYYAAADLAFIGGSLLPFGGQNIIEACAVGTPVLVGPHTYNFAEVTYRAVKAGTALQIKDSEELIVLVQNLLGSPDNLSEMRHQCDTFVKSNRGATDRAIEIIKAAFK